MKSKTVINLEDLRKGQPAVSKAVAGYLIEGAVFCLESQGHCSGVRVEIEGAPDNPYYLIWSESINEQTRKSWNDHQEATEYGATAVAMAIIAHLTEFKIIERATKGTSIDYWLGSSQNAKGFLLKSDRKAKLEISGIWKESPKNTINIRVRKKINQVQRTKEPELPVIIVVVAFSGPKAKIVNL